MSIPVTIEKLLEENVVEWARIEFKEGFNPDAILKTISAFGNDIDNWGGGYILIGAKEVDGKLERPVKGLDESKIDAMQKELLQYCKYLKPSYIPQCEPVYIDGKVLLLIWCPGGYERPYACPKYPSKKNSEKIYYIRKLSSTIEANELEVKELMMLSNNIPFDDRINYRAELNDLNYQLLKDYLKRVDSGLKEGLASLDVKTIAENLRIADGPKEFFKPRNIGLLFFNENPERFFPYCRIELVNMPDPTGQGMEERTFVGPIDEQLISALKYIKNNVLAEKVFKLPYQAEALRIKNYSYKALEEFISNAVYHRSYQVYEPITIRIEKDKIEIISAPGPDRSISDDDIKNLTMRTRRYRNRRIGDFLKELHLVEGRNTGIPSAIKSIKENGSPLPIFLTDEDRTFFSVTLPIHEAFKIDEKKKQIPKSRKSREEIKELIIETLMEEEMSANSLYSLLGYSGNVSKTFKECIDGLVEDNIIEYTCENKKSSENTLRRKFK